VYMTGTWTSEEHIRFVQAVRTFGKNWKMITEFIGTRSRAQVGSHAQDFRTQIRKYPNLLGSDILPILETGARGPRSYYPQ